MIPCWTVWRGLSSSSLRVLELPQVHDSLAHAPRSNIRGHLNDAAITAKEEPGERASLPAATHAGASIDQAGKQDNENSESGNKHYRAKAGRRSIGDYFVLRMHLPLA
jgi:hypothetical protein